MFPKLIISERASDIIQDGVNQGAVLITGSLDDIVDSLSSLKRAMLDGVVLVGDINPEVVGQDVENRLLKLLENLLVNAVFISSGDGFSEIFLSRFVEVKKEMSVFQVRESSEIGFRAMLREFLNGEQRNEKTRDLMPDVIKDASGFFVLYRMYSDSHIPKKSKMLDVWVRGGMRK